MIKGLINAIAQGDSLAIEDTFNAVMASKISERLDDMRVEVAHGMFGSVVEESIEDYSVEELEDYMMSEEFEQLDELSKKTLGSYVKAATVDLANTSELRGAGSAQMAVGKPNKDIPDGNTLYNKQGKRIRGISKAVGKLTK
jgi:predicted DNA-binding protein